MNTKKVAKGESTYREYTRNKFGAERVGFFYIGSNADLFNYSACVAWVYGSDGLYRAGISYLNPDDKRAGAPKAVSRYLAMEALNSKDAQLIFTGQIDGFEVEFENGRKKTFTPGKIEVYAPIVHSLKLWSKMQDILAATCDKIIKGFKLSNIDNVHQEYKSSIYRATK
jgi:hypothetical protein